jgi:PAS domain S-box-containing protein
VEELVFVLKENEMIKADPTPVINLDPSVVSMDLVAVVEQLPDGLLLAGRDGVVRLANHRLEEMLGFSRGELIGQPVEVLLPTTARHRHVGLREAFSAAPTVRPMGSGRELVAQCKSGALLPVEVSLSPLTGGEQSQIIAIVRDVTVQRHIAEERKLAQSQRDNQARLWETLAGLSTDLFGNPSADVLRVLSTKALELLQADAVLITGSQGDAQYFEVRSSTGAIEAPSVVAGNPLFEHMRNALHTHEATRVELDAGDPEPFWLRTPDGIPMTYAVLTPFANEAGSFVLSAFRVISRDAFDDDEVELLDRFVEHARLVVEVAERRRQERRMAVLEDRQRIARDLHDRVVGRLFATGLGLQGLMSIATPAVREQADRAVEEIDQAIADLRHAIFSLMHTDEHVTIGALRRLVRRTLFEKEALGFDIHFDGEGPDVVVDPILVDHVMAVVSEAVVNAHRHARCSKVEVHLANDANSVTLRVTDNGVGFTPGISPGNGLSSLLERARELGGSCELSSAPGEGTSVVWSVPVS